MSNNKSGNAALSSLGGIVLFGILAALKVGPWDNPVQDWSWWWVTAPLWLGYAIAAVIVLICAVILGLVHIFDKTGK